MLNGAKGWETVPMTLSTLFGCSAHTSVCVFWERKYPIPGQKSAWHLKPLAPLPTVASARPESLFTKRVLFHGAAAAALVMGRRGLPAAARETVWRSAATICRSVSKTIKGIEAKEEQRDDGGRQARHAVARRTDQVAHDK